jgi:hypothetical protein
MPSCTMTPYHGRVKATHNHGGADRCPPATQHCTDLECCSILCLCLLVCPLTLSPRYTLPGCHQLRHRTCRVSCATHSTDLAIALGCTMLFQQAKMT